MDGPLIPAESTACGTITRIGHNSSWNPQVADGNFDTVVLEQDGKPLHLANVVLQKLTETSPQREMNRAS
jgi:hypothetical protein